jgi:hypothetical protein
MQDVRTSLPGEHLPREVHEARIHLTRENRAAQDNLPRWKNVLLLLRRLRSLHYGLHELRPRRTQDHGSNRILKHAMGGVRIVVSGAL